MRYVRVYLLPDGTPWMVQEQGAPFSIEGMAELDGVPLTCVDLGAVDSPDGRGLARALCESIEKHPHADDHEDAPRVRVREDADVPAIHWTPTTYKGIADHLAARGEDALPTPVCEHLKQCLAHTEHATVRALRALGYSFDQIRAMPRMVQARARLAQNMLIEQQRQAEAEREAVEREAERIRQQRIERRLNERKEANQ